jgi:hypothetical protein
MREMSAAWAKIEVALLRDGFQCRTAWLPRSGRVRHADDNSGYEPVSQSGCTGYGDAGASCRRRLSIVYRWFCRKECIWEFAFEKSVLGVLSWRGLTGGRAVANTIPPSAATPTAATAGRKALQSRKASPK